MAVEIKIKQKGLFHKKKISLEDILLDGMKYGITDGHYRLVEGEQGNPTVIYDAKRMARGINVLCRGTSVMMHMNIPTSLEEIDLLYKIIEKVCGLYGTNVFYRGGEKTDLSEIPDCIRQDKMGSGIGLKNLLARDDDGYITIFGVKNPLCLGPAERKRIANDIQAFGDYLAERQEKEVWYADPDVYQDQEKDLIFGIVEIECGTNCVVPVKPDITLSQGTVEKVYARLGNRTKDLVRYADFINAVKGKEYYDANHVIICLSKDEAGEILEKYRTGLEG